jgi:hypothetical protein
MDDIKIIISGAGKHPLYQLGPDREPNPAVIELDVRDGTLRAYADDAQSDTVPWAVYQGAVRWFEINPKISRQALEQLLEDMRPLAERVVSGHYIPTPRGRVRLSWDAKRALEQIEWLAEEHELDAEPCGELGCDICGAQ